MLRRRKLLVIAAVSCLGLGALGPLLGAPGAVTVQAADAIARKIECHVVQMIANRVANSAAEKAASVAAEDIGDVPLTQQPHDRSTLSAKGLALLQQQACATNAGVWKTLSQWCETLTGGAWCSPTKLALALCEKGKPCRAALDALGRTRDTIKVAALAPFRTAWAAIRGKPLPISPSSVDAAQAEMQSAEESDGAHPYGSAEPAIDDPATTSAAETVAESGGGDAAQAAGDTSRALEAGVTPGDAAFADATTAADAAEHAGNGDDGATLPDRSEGTAPELAAAGAAEDGAAASGKLAVGLKFAKAGLKGALKVAGWIGLAWSAVDFLGEITANYTTSNAIQGSGWHYYGLLDIIPASVDAGGILVSSDKAAVAGRLAAFSGSKLMSCQDLIDLEAQVLGDPTSVANAEIVGSFLDPTRAGHSDAPSYSGGYGHVDQDKTIHDPVLNLVPAGKKTFDANLADLLTGGVGGRPGNLGPLCDLTAPGTPQPKTPDWRGVIEQAIARDKRLAGVVDAGARASEQHPFGVPDEHAFTDWTLDDLYTFGLGADPLAHYGNDGDLLGNDESIASGRCLAAMALTPYHGTWPLAYRELLSDLRSGNYGPYYRLLDAATALHGAADMNTHSCLYAPMEQVPDSLSSCVTTGGDPVNAPPAVRALAYGMGQCGLVPLWSTQSITYPDPSHMSVDSDGRVHFTGTDYPDVTLSQALSRVVRDCACDVPPEPSGAVTDGIDFDAAARATGYISTWSSTDASTDSPQDQLQDQVAAMALALCDVFGEGDQLFTTARSSSPTQDLGSGAGGDIGCAQMRPSEIGQALSEAVQSGAPPDQPVDLTSDETLDEAVVVSLRDDLAAHGGDVRAAFAEYIRANHLPPYNGAWHGDARYEPGQPATDIGAEGLGDWSSELGLTDGRHIPHVPSADLLTAAYQEYLLYLRNGDVGNQEAVGSAPGAAFLAGAGVVFPPRDQMSAFATAAQRTGAPTALLIALAATETDNTFDPAMVSSARGVDGSPVAYGEFQMPPTTFIAAGGEAALPPSAFAPLPDARAGPDWGEPQGELDVALEALSAAQFLSELGATGSPTTDTLEVAVYRFVHGSTAPLPGDTAQIAADPTVASVVMQKYPPYAAWVVAGEPAAGGATPTCASGFCEVPMATVFPWVPSGGFPDPYPFGQCTYFAAFNVDPFRPSAISNLGNGGDWYASARAMGLATLPASVLPPYGSAVSYHGFKGDSGAGHVAVVISDDVDGHGYWVAEMNVIATNQGTGRVDVSHHAFPDPFLMGSILQSTS
jgi:hypothetical protein